MRFPFNVNGQLMFQDFDNGFGQALTGFGCGPFKKPGLHRSFDNLSIWDEEVRSVWEDDFDDDSGNWFESLVP